MADENVGPNATIRIIGTVALLISLLASIYGLGKPMLDRIDYINNATDVRLNSIDKALKEHSERGAHTGADLRITSLERQVQENRSRFDGEIRHLTDVINLQNQNQERINALIWEKVFEIEYPKSDYWPLGNISGSGHEGGS